MKILLPLIFVTNILVIQGANNCDHSQKYKTFAEQCANRPSQASELTMENPKDNCKSYFVCKVQTIQEKICGQENGQQLYFHNGKCQKGEDKKCESCLKSEEYENFIRMCAETDPAITPQFHQANKADGCKSYLMCEKRKVTLHKCDNNDDQLGSVCSLIKNDCLS